MYEYKIERIFGGQEYILNNLAAEGWEPVSICSDGTYDHAVIVLLRRPR
jgi:hypothetical protein